MASRIPALPRDSHVQSHAAVHKNKLCDSRAPLVARVIPVTGLDPLGSVTTDRFRASDPCPRRPLRFGFESFAPSLEVHLKNKRNIWRHLSLKPKI